jgi:hypothetical protein
LKLIESRLRFGEDGLALLVEQGWEEKKFRVFDFETAAAFADAAFAQDDDLAAGSEGVRDDSPFFECDAHKKKRGAMAPRLISKI